MLSDKVVELQSKDEDHLRLNTLFLEYSNRVVAFGEQAGVKITAYRDERLPHFSRLDARQKQDVLKGLEVYIKICETTLSHQENLGDSTKVVWHAMRILGLRPESSLFENMTNDDIIEIHNTERQLFRNFAYYRLCSYTLEELASFPWTELYVRNESLETYLIQCVSSLIETKKFLVPDIPEHIIEESFSPFRYKLKYKLKFMAPLAKKDSNLPHFLVAINADFDKSDKAEIDQESLLANHYKHRLEL